ncbi:phosphoribosylglycinamide formyltransferase [Candidatus Endomicrobiellum trichonymphae]|uniref:phosphoribosylglycinamide formyltransferase n=1 Tax=Endomicrobium trichonymphae TaxID=1408204 RepID=UPI000865210D|nr:phosphoribosylglycinamide formyltransferase [Candidatus Endomicrobium trichonymphae]BAV59277.1 phosphoribosylglycinamide formyltransferase [Candidatus Endomicrobium trichonymphae]
MKERKNRGYIVKRLAILVSGSGSNMQSIADSTNRGILKGLAAIVLVISNNPNAYALRRAENENIKAVCIERKDFEDEKSFNGAILEELQNTKVDIVCLAGYMRMIGQEIMDVYRGRMLNIHPALLPKFGGKGMYGYHVHEAVVKAGEKKSGVTVHFVEEEYDTGKIVIQREVEVFKSYTPQDVAKKVLAVEHRIYPEAIKKVVENEL